MSRKIAMDTICLRPTPRLAHTEYSMEYHKPFIESYQGRYYEEWGYDFFWSTNDGPLDWSKGRRTNLGHAAYAADGSDQHNPGQCPFEDVEEVYEFDPVREYGLPGQGELVKYYEDLHQKAKAAKPEQLITGGYYKTVVSGALESFGWDMLLMAAADPQRFAPVLQRFGAYTRHYAEAWAKTSIEVYIQHDDMVWSQGPFMHPEFYRSVIFPLYKQMWLALKKAGKKVLFCSDGTFDMFMEDIAACGADGFIFEPMNDLDSIVKRFGKTHCLVGSKVDCRTMTFGTWEQVKAEMDATFPLAKACPGFMWAVGNHIPANVSDEMCTRYIQHLKANWTR